MGGSKIERDKGGRGKEREGKGGTRTEKKWHLNVVDSLHNDGVGAGREINILIEREGEGEGVV